MGWFFPYIFGRIQKFQTVLNGLVYSSHKKNQSLKTGPDRVYICIFRFIPL